METGISERRAQIVLLVRAFEEVDRSGRILPTEARSAATRRAMMVTGLASPTAEFSRSAHIRSGETVMRRARLLFDSLTRKLNGLPLVLGTSRLAAGTVMVIIACFALGLMTNVLGPLRKINLLWLPLLGMLAWNLLTYALLVAAALAGVLRKQRRTPVGWSPGRRASRLSELLLKLGIGYRLKRWRISNEPTRARVATKAILRFGALWHRAARSLLSARMRRMLHLGALALVVGALSGMYVRGLVFEYRATWESTLLSADQVQAILQVLLGPAAWVLNVSLPDIGTFPAEGGAAAVWIHLYAITALLYVVVPRGILAAYEGVRCARAAHRIRVDFEDPYYLRLFTEWRGARKFIEIVPYSYRPSPSAVNLLRTMLHDLFGARAEIELRAPVAYGEQPPAVRPRPKPTGDDPPRKPCRVVLFNLSQTPEIDVHAAFLQELKDLLDESDGKLIVFLDVSAYRKRVQIPQRWKERSAAWNRVAREAGLSAVLLDPDHPADDTAREAIEAAVWTSGEVIEVSP